MDSSNHHSNHSGQEHVYDGIVEQNNPMPDWWIWLFILTIAFAFVYWIHYASGSGPTLRQEYDQAFKQYEQDLEKAADKADVETEDSLAAYGKSEPALLNGAGIFATKCAMCHGENLEGKIGPNLTDNFWTTGDGSRMAVLHTIAKGSAAKGMPPWEGILKPKELKDVLAFVYSKIGTRPAQAKAPEGQEVKK